MLLVTQSEHSFSSAFTGPKPPINPDTSTKYSTERKVRDQAFDDFTFQHDVFFGDVIFKNLVTLPTVMIMVP